MIYSIFAQSLTLKFDFPEVSAKMNFEMRVWKTRVLWENAGTLKCFLCLFKSYTIAQNSMLIKIRAPTLKNVNLGVINLIFFEKMCHNITCSTSHPLPTHTCLFFCIFINPFPFPCAKISVITSFVAPLSAIFCLPPLLFLLNAFLS